MSAATDPPADNTVLDYGDRALLLQFDSSAELLAFTAALREAALPGVLDIVPASRTVLIKLDGPRYQGATRQRLRTLRVTPAAMATLLPDGHIDVVIDVVYDGADLTEVATRTGLTIPQVVDAHTATPWRVGFGGFTPGFAYLVGGDPRLAVPRLSEPRQSVPAGSVGLAGEFSGIYPRQSPGGWQLIGQTDAVLWDIDRADPALLVPGMWVRFRASRPATMQSAHHDEEESGNQTQQAGGYVVATLEILRTGPLALIEDLGRVGLAHLGVTRSGAADRRSHRLANRLVANPDDRATVEVTFGGFCARVRGGGVDIAVTGADTDPAVNGVVFGTNSVHHLRDGEVLSLGSPRFGLRTYLGLRGGIDVTPVLGSRSCDVMSGIGPLPLRPDDMLPVGEHTGDYPELDQAPVATIDNHLVELLVVPGPRDDWLVDPDALVRTVWMASTRSDRVGMRLDARPLCYRWPDRQLPSEGAARGAIQVPPNGLPVIFGPDHPVTGGYPVAGVVIEDNVDKVAQIRPGQYVRLHWSRPRS
jgi:KipI family sensor histidine kinase inhibitor